MEKNANIKEWKIKRKKEIKSFQSDTENSKEGIVWMKIIPENSEPDFI